MYGAWGSAVVNLILSPSAVTAVLKTLRQVCSRVIDNVKRIANKKESRRWSFKSFLGGRVIQGDWLGASRQSILDQIL